MTRSFTAPVSFNESVQPSLGVGGMMRTEGTPLSDIPAKDRPGAQVQTTDPSQGSQPASALNENGYSFVGPGLAYGNYLPNGTPLDYPTYSYRDPSGDWVAVAQNAAGQSADIPSNIGGSGNLFSVDFGGGGIGMLGSGGGDQLNTPPLTQE